MYNVLARSRTQKLHEELKAVARRLHNILTFFGYEYKKIWSQEMNIRRALVP
jgi:hypothetical protein